MKKKHLIWKSFFSVLLTLPLTAVPSNLNHGIQKILSQSKMPVHTGIVVRNAKTGRLLYSQHSHYLFEPASVQKLFTATAAIKYLGPHFTFKTHLLSNGIIKNHTLNGNIAIKFNGDPSLSNDDLAQLLDVLRTKGITKINGHVYLDTSAYDNVYYPPGWLWDDLSYSYAAPLSAIIINKNKFILRLTPAKHIGAKPSLSVDIPNDVIHFTNHVKTTAEYNKHCPLTIYSDANNHFTLDGCLNKKWGRQRRNLSIRNPIPYAKTVIRQILKDDGIRIKGKITVLHVNNKYKLLNENRSPTLRALIKKMLKKSDNLITDTFFKQLGHQYFKHQGNWQNGARALKIILKPTGIDFKKNLINDGAGLSRYDLISPLQLSQLLKYIYTQPSIKPVLMEALPIAGIDGTLVGRMYSEAKDKRIRAKTGTMTGITALAGYIYTRHLGILSFTIMMNGFLGKSHPYTQLEDRVCEYLAHYKKRTHA